MSYMRSIDGWADNVYAEKYKAMGLDLSITVKDLMNIFDDWNLGVDGVSFYNGDRKIFSKTVRTNHKWNAETMDWDTEEPIPWKELIKTVDEKDLKKKVYRAEEDCFPDGSNWLSIYTN